MNKNENQNICPKCSDTDVKVIVEKDGERALYL